MADVMTAAVDGVDEVLSTSNDQKIAIHHEEHNNNNHSLSTPTPSTKKQLLGGSNGSNGIPAYALLVGKLDPTYHNEDNDIITIPITRLPVTLGKEHATKDPSFIALKEPNNDNSEKTNTKNAAPKLSQSMCCIFYRDSYGGKLGLYKKGRKKTDDNENNNKDVGSSNIAETNLDGMMYKPYEPPTPPTLDEDGNEISSSNKNTEQPLPNDIIRLPNMKHDTPLPNNGFFAIECTGRKIIVGGNILKKGQIAMLTDGMPIKIASHCFYFLLPKSNEKKSPPSIKVTVTIAASPTSPKNIKAEKTTPKKKMKKPRSDSIDSSKSDANSNNDDSTKKNKKKKPRSDSISSNNSSVVSTKNDDGDDNVVSPPSKKKKKTTRGPPKFNESIYNNLSNTELLQLLSQKITETTWDNPSQKLGSTIATRVCLAAAQSPYIQSICRSEGGVTQREIMDWMNDTSSPNGGGHVFGEFERMMLSKIEKKSFNITMGKGLLRAKYTKNVYLSGRAFRWNLPEEEEDVIIDSIGIGTKGVVEGGSTVPTGGGGEVLKKGAEEGKCAKNDESKQPAAAGSSVDGEKMNKIEEKIKEDVKQMVVEEKSFDV